jgi:hypothetical protein
MNILILHKRAYDRMQYDRAIDHDAHRVTYVGTETTLRSLPADLPCERIARPGTRSLYEEVLEILGANAPRFDRIVSFSELELLDAARLRETLGVPGPRYDEVLRVRDKIRMKEAVQAGGVRVPAHMHAARAVREQPSWNGRTVLKPLDGAFSENVQVYPSAAEAVAAIRDGSHGIRNFDVDRYELEEFVEGDVIYFDGLVVEGVLIAVVASRYVGSCLGYAAGEPLGSVQFDADAALRSWADACVTAVGLHTSSFHLEAILATDGPVFLEIAGRVGGGEVVECFERATGMHMPSLELRALVDPASVAAMRPTKADTRFGFFMFPGHHLGEDSCDVVGVERFLRHPHVLRTSLLPPGARLERHITYLAGEAPFVGLVGGATTAELEETLRQMFREVHIVPRGGLANRAVS